MACDCIHWIDLFGWYFEAGMVALFVLLAFTLRDH